MSLTTIQYKCSCMQDEGSFTMIARGESEDLRDFMDRMDLKLAADHVRRNPICRATATEYVKIYIPAGDDKSIGHV